MDYLKRLDNYDASIIAQTCLDYQLYEEAFEIYRKHDLEAEALDVLLNKINDINRGAEFAEKMNSPEVFA